MLQPMTTPTSLTLKDVRLICQTRDRLAQLGIAADSFFTITARLRQEYIRQVGLKRYLADMLGSYGGLPAQSCVAYHDEVQVDQPGNPQETILYYLLRAAAHHPSRLPPNRLEIHQDGKVLTFSL